MKRFGVVQQRQSHEPTETDLRGLGQELFFKHSHPIAVLTAIAGTSSLESVKGLLGSQFKHAQVGNKLHFLLNEDMAGAHKRDALQFYFATLNASRSVAFDVKFVLWEARPGEEYLSHSIKGTPTRETVMQLIDRMFCRVPANGDFFIRVMPPVSLHLQQAECEGVVATAQHRDIQKTEAIQRLNIELSRQSSTNHQIQQRKVG